MFVLHQGKRLLLLLLLLVSICMLVSSSDAQSVYTYHLCLDQSSTDAPSNRYISDLNSLVSSLTSKAADSTFYDDTLNGVYGLFLCRGDVSNSVCQSCVSSASQGVRRRCPNDRSAVIWYERCLFRYSNTSFFGIPEKGRKVFMYNTQNNTTPDEPDAGAIGIIYTLVAQAPYTELMYAADEAAVMGGSQRRYGLVQCTRDLSTDDCRKCLLELANYIPQGRRGWRILSPSCYLRYEDSLFFELPVPAPSPAALPAPPEGGGGNSSEKLKIVVITVSTVSGVVVSCLGLWLCVRVGNKKKRKGIGMSQEILLNDLENPASKFFEEASGHDQNNPEVHYFSLEEMRAATNDFSASNKLGEGGFGPVYKGKLPDGKEVAVKRLSMRSGQGFEEFKNEVMLIAKLQHKNLVKLWGCCVDKNEKLLVYEYLANTSLDAFLFDSEKKNMLDWEKRASIVMGIAKGILYLHEDSRLKIIHRDLKASNVLLDDDMNPKISDFGTARIFEGNQIDANTNRVVGTYGYMAPEYAMEGLFSVKSDVYSFGILLLEILSGRKNSGTSIPERGQSLLMYVWKLWMEGDEAELIDEALISTCRINLAVRWIHIGLLCVQEELSDRPTMSSVVLMLGSESVNLPQPSPPPFSTGKHVFSRRSTTTETGVLTSDQSSTSASI